MKPKKQIFRTASMICCSALALGCAATGFGLVLHANAAEDVQTGVVTDNAVYTTDGVELLGDTTFDIKYGTEGAKWKDMVWSSVNDGNTGAGKLTVSWIAEDTDQWAGDCGFYQTVTVEKNTDYAVSFKAWFTADEWQQIPYPLVVGIGTEYNNDVAGQYWGQTWIQKAEIADVTPTRGAVTYRVAFNSGDHESVQLRFGAWHFPPSIKGKYNVYEIDDASMQKITGTTGEEASVVAPPEVTTATEYVTDGTELLVNGVFNNEAQPAGWETAAWGALDAGTKQGKITTSWTAGDNFTGTIGFFQTVTVKKNTDYLLKFDAGCTGWKAKTPAALYVGFGKDITTKKWNHEDWLYGQKVMLNGLTSKNTTYYAVLNSGDNETLQLCFGSNYRAPDAASTFGGYWIDNASLQEVTGKVAGIAEAETGILTANDLYYRTSDIELVTNGDFHLNVGAEGAGWKNIPWGGTDAQRGKLTVSYDKDTYHNSIGIYQTVDVRPNTYYYLTFRAGFQADEWIAPPVPLYVGLGEDIALPTSGADSYNKWNASWIEDQKVVKQDTPRFSDFNKDATTYAVAFYSGNRSKVQLRFGSTYVPPEVNHHFAAYYIDDVSFRMITEEIKPYDKNAYPLAKAETERLYETDGVEKVKNGTFENFDNWATTLGAWANKAGSGEYAQVTYAMTKDTPPYYGAHCIYQDIDDMEKDTYYLVSFKARYWDNATNGRTPPVPLIVGICDPAAAGTGTTMKWIDDGRVMLKDTDGIPELESFDGAPTFYFVFNTRDLTKVQIRIATNFRQPLDEEAEHGKDGRYYVDDLSVQKITGEKKIEVSEVKLDREELSLIIGAEYQLHATVLPDRAADKAVSWETDQETIATVDPDGTVHAIGEGQAHITAKAGGQQAVCTVTVSMPALPEEIAYNKLALEELYYTTGEDLVKNGDFSAITNDWGTLPWGAANENNENKGKLCFSYLNGPADVSYTGGNVGIYQNIKVEKNTAYYLSFNAWLQSDEWLMGPYPFEFGLATADGNTGNWDTTWITRITKADLRKIERDETVPTYYFAFNSGDREEIQIRFATHYQPPQFSQNFGAYWVDNVSVKKILAEKESTLADPYWEAALIPEDVSLYETGDEIIQNGDFSSKEGWQSSLNAWASVEAEAGRAQLTYAQTQDDNHYVGEHRLYQVVTVEPNTDYLISFRASYLDFAPNRKPQTPFVVGFARQGAEFTGYRWLEGQMCAFMPASGKIADAPTFYVVLNSGDNTELELRFATNFRQPNSEAEHGASGKYYFDDVSMKKVTNVIEPPTQGGVVPAEVTQEPKYLTKGEELLLNGTFDIPEMQTGCGWEIFKYGNMNDEGWGRGKLTYSWWPDSYDGSIGIYQTVNVTPNTNYYLVFESYYSGLDPVAPLYVGFGTAYSESAPWDETWLPWQKATIHDVPKDSARLYYVAFNSGDYTSIQVRFGSNYMPTTQANVFGGYWIDNVSLKEIDGVIGSKIDFSATTENGGNYVFLGEGEQKIDVSFNNLAESGLTREEVTLTYEMASGANMAQVAQDGTLTLLDTAKLGRVSVLIKAKAEKRGKIYYGEKLLVLSVLYATGDEVYLNGTDEDYPLTLGTQNLLENGDFESGAIDAGADLTSRTPGWHSLYGGWQATEELAGIDRTTGGKITWNWENGLSEDVTVGFYQDVDVKPYTVYEVSFVVETWLPGAPISPNTLFVGHLDPKGTTPLEAHPVSSTDMPAIESNTWTSDNTDSFVKVTCFLYSGEASVLRFAVWAQAQQGDDKCGWWFDNFEMREATDVKSGNEAVDLDVNIPATIRMNEERDLRTFEVYAHNYHKEIEATFTYASEDPDVAAVEGGKLVAKKVGTTTITVTGEYGGRSINKEYTVDVKPYPQSLKVSVGATNSVIEGRDQKIKVILVYSDGTEETIASGIVYTTSDEGIIAQRGNTNYLSGKKAGTATLTATYTVDGYTVSGSCEVTVTPKSTQPTNPDQPGEQQPGGEEDGGCGGAIFGAGGFLVALLSGVVLLRKKKH